MLQFQVPLFKAVQWLVFLQTIRSPLSPRAGCSADSPGGVLKQTVVRAEHLMREKVEPLPGQPPVVQPLLPSKLNIEPRVEVAEVAHVGHRSEAVLKQIVPTNRNFLEVWNTRLEGEREGKREKFASTAL